MERVHLSQAKNYLEAYKIPIGLLINFEKGYTAADIENHLLKQTQPATA